MLEITYKFTIIDDCNLLKLLMVLTEYGIKHKKIDNETVEITINSIAERRLVINLIAEYIIDIKWQNSINPILYSLGIDKDSLKKEHEYQLSKIKNGKLLKILTIRTIDSYLNDMNNQTLNIQSFIIFNMNGFDKYLIDEIKDCNFQEINIDIKEKETILKKIEKISGLKKEFFNTLYILKDTQKESEYRMLNNNLDEIDVDFYSKRIGFEINEEKMFRTKELLYLTMILNTAALFDTKHIIVDKNATDLLDLLASNITFDKIKVAVKDMNQEEILKILSSERENII